MACNKYTKKRVNVRQNSQNWASEFSSILRYPYFECVMDTTLSPNPGCPPCTLCPNERLLTICFGRRLQSRIWEQSLTSPNCERRNHFHRMHIAYGSYIWTTSDIDQDFSGPILFNGKKKSIWIQIWIYWTKSGARALVEQHWPDCRSR